MDDLLEALVRVVCWPYEAWKESLEGSRVGNSDEDRKTLRFWKRFAMIGVAVAVTAALGWVLVTDFLG